MLQRDRHFSAFLEVLTYINKNHVIPIVILLYQWPSLNPKPTYTMYARMQVLASYLTVT